MHKLKMISAICMILFIMCSTVLIDIDDGLKFSRNEVINDMFLPNEGIPHGVPNYIDWKTKPRVNLGNNMKAGWNVVLSWGQVYAEESMPNPDQDFPLARVHIKDLEIYILRKNGDWVRIDSQEGPEGALFVEDFIDDENKKAEIRDEKGGGISIQAGSGYNFHFYGDMIEFDRDDIAGVFAVCKARLIGIEKYSVMPKYLMDIGGDYWKDKHSDWEGTGVNNDDIAIGRFKYVTPQWRYFTMHTFKKEETKNIIFPLE